MRRDPGPGRWTARPASYRQRPNSTIRALRGPMGSHKIRQRPKARDMVKLSPRGWFHARDRLDRLYIPPLGREGLISPTRGGNRPDCRRKIPIYFFAKSVRIPKMITKRRDSNEGYRRPLPDVGGVTVTDESVGVLPAVRTRDTPRVSTRILDAADAAAMPIPVRARRTLRWR
jgi:hypothetical protein